MKYNKYYCCVCEKQVTMKQLKNQEAYEKDGGYFGSCRGFDGELEYDYFDGDTYYYHTKCDEGCE